MPEIKLVVSDMDDTLAQQMQHEVSESVRQAVLDVQQGGVELAAVSGRGYSHAKQLLNVLGITGPCVLDGGASIYDAETGELQWQQWLEADTVRRVMTAVSQHCIEGYFTAAYEMQELTDLALESIDEAAPNVFALAPSYESIEQVVKDLANVEDLYIHVGKGHHPSTGEKLPAIQIMHARADKFHGVEALRAIKNIPKEHTLAIGDGDNDLPLFENAALKIAMGNATDTLKSKADYIVADVDHDGFAEAMYKYVLGEHVS